MKERLFEIWFYLCCGAGNSEFPQLLEQYGTPYDLYNITEAELDSLPCSDKLKTRLANKSLAAASEILDKCLQNDIRILFWQDENYPASLRPLRDPPVLLYYRGNLPDFSRRLCISVVGTRNMSEYGKHLAYRIGYELGAAGAMVVSGMALGIDGVAAAGALLGGGTTVAVLGSGLNRPYPYEHGRLFDKIVEKGVVISEYPPDTPPNRWQFPARNRIVSGLSQGTVVVEAPKRSGTLITAHNAILQGRDIYAFPGNVGQANSAGSNMLISHGAAVILRTRDLLENYLYLYNDTLNMERLGKAEACSGIDETGLESLGVCRRTVKTIEDASSARISSAAPSGDDRREAPSHICRGTETPDPRLVQEKFKPTKSSPSKAIEPPKSTPAHGDASRAALQSLTDTQRRIFEVLPLDHAVAIDYFTREGYTVGEVMAAMTVLEIKGLTVTLPGALFSRK